jgi:hypothetical protein
MANPTWEPMKERKNKQVVCGHFHFYLFLGIVNTLVCTCALSQNAQQPAGDSNSYRVMFYNTENLFDVANDSLTADDDFTPAGNLHWTYKRYLKKLDNISKVIIAAGGWQPPDVIGICEVENRKVLMDLINNTPLLKFPYRIVHEDSPDRRGIDVALLFDNQTVRFLMAKSFRIPKEGLKTRNILYVKLILNPDTCHFFVNHWPSRSAGRLETDPDRVAAAAQLKILTDSVLNINPNARIIIMGDFNDDPQDKSIVEVLGAGSNRENPVPGRLYNLAEAPSKGAIQGTLKYQGAWNTFDQFIVSGSLLTCKKGIVVAPGGYHILNNVFLLEVDERFNGFKPFRTYNGYHYKGGFSDHLPVYLDLVLR